MDRFHNTALQGVSLPPAQMQVLNQAYDLHLAGHSSQAALMFARLAAELETENDPRRAASLTGWTTGRWSANTAAHSSGRSSLI